MNRKMIVAAIGFVVAVAIGLHFYVEWQMARFDASLPTPPAAEEQAGGHWHGDEWHADDAHENDTGETELIPSVDWHPSTGRPHEAVKPEGLDELDVDDPVAKAWAKLDYIADNPFAWGGNADPRTAGLVQQLMPRPDGIEDDAHAEEILLPLDDLIHLRDPRAIETLVAYLCWNSMAYASLGPAVSAMGPLAIPYLLPYLEEEPPKEGEAFSGFIKATGFLANIGKRHREELDGIVEYIILPKLKQILATPSLSPYVRKRVEEQIDRLKQ